MSTAEHDRKLLTVRETADRLRVSVPTVRRHIRHGRLPAVQLGGRGSAVRIDTRKLDEFVYGNPERATRQQQAVEQRARR